MKHSRTAGKLSIYSFFMLTASTALTASSAHALNLWGYEDITPNNVKTCLTTYDGIEVQSGQSISVPTSNNPLSDMFGSLFVSRAPCIISMTGFIPSQPNVLNSQYIWTWATAQECVQDFTTHCPMSMPPIVTPSPTPVSPLPAPVYTPDPMPVYDSLSSPVYTPDPMPVYDSLASPVYTPDPMPMYDSPPAPRG